MEMKVSEFERYVERLSAGIRLDITVKESICAEIRQALYDKYDELLIKGYGSDKSITYTLECFEEPETLAGQFNDVYKPGMDFHRAIVFVQSKKLFLVAVAATLIITLIM